MSGFDLDLQTVEEHIDDETDDESARTIVLGILDGSTPDEEWIDAVEAGKVLVLSIEGDVNELAAGFAREINDAGGELVRFREVLVVTPPDVAIDMERLRSSDS